MKKRSIYLAGIVLLSIVVIVGFFIHGNHDEIDKTVQKYAPTGASIAIIENGEIKEIRNYGYANKEEEKFVTNDTRFKIASISKTMTSYAVMQLVEEGKLNLDASVNEYLTKWKIPKSDYGEDNVTLRMLLSHTAGLTGSDELGYSEPLPSVDEALRMRDVKLQREPGTQFEYSEFVGHGICQLVIEEVTGMPFVDYMVSYVFEPLGMMHTDYTTESNGKGELAVPYAGNGVGTEVVPIVMNGAGGVTTTSHDLALFEIALMKYYHAGSGEMFEEQENTQSEGGTYALGIIPRRLSDGTVVYEHNGTLTGWNAQLAIEPESGNGIAVVTNSDKAYYMTYDLMEIWSKMSLGEAVVDKLMHQIEQKTDTVAVGMLIGILIFGTGFVIKWKNKRLIWIRNNRKIGFCILFFLLAIILDGVLFYTDWVFRFLWKMEDYYLFTFFPLTFRYIQIEIGSLLILFLIRINMKKKC